MDQKWIDEIMGMHVKTVKVQGERIGLQAENDLKKNDSEVSYYDFFRHVDGVIEYRKEGQI